MAPLDIVSAVFIGIGVFFVLTAGIGMLRMPDVFTRMHAAGMSDTMGAGMILFGLAIHEGFTGATLRLVLIILFLWFTSPISSHALAKAALHGNVKPFTKRGDTASQGG